MTSMQRILFRVWLVIVIAISLVPPVQRTTYAGRTVSGEYLFLFDYSQRYHSIDSGKLLACLVIVTALAALIASYEAPIMKCVRWLLPGKKGPRPGLDVPAEFPGTGGIEEADSGSS